jgi:eukaryotic-like serine/threonine-protein kinase
VQPEPPPPPSAPPTEPLPPEEPPAERHLWPWLVALAIVVLAGLALLIVLATRDNSTKRVTVPATGTVPSVITLPKAVAVRRITRAGLDAQVRFTASSKPKGIVVAQEPEGGARLAHGGVVAIAVSAGKPKLAVPDVVGLTVAAAVKRLQAAGLDTRQRVVFAAAPAGRVVSQRPAAGAEAKKGATVSLSVSKGPQRVRVPNVVGRGRDDAVARLKDAGLVAAVFSVPSQAPRGFVVAQNPSAGTKVPKRSRVRLNVSRGAPSATETTATTTLTQASVRVPQVLGQSQSTAVRRLRAAGFRVSTAYVASSKPQGRVVAQSPAAGTRLREGSRVRINVSNGPNPKPLKAVPDVTGEDEATATADLRAAGFPVEVVDQPTADEKEDGVVLDQDPSVGTRVPTGSLVTIYVGRFSG